MDKRMFQAAIVLLMIGASATEGYNGRWALAAYWASGALINGIVGFWIKG